MPQKNKTISIDKLITKVELRLDGRDWPIVITHNTLIECEDLTGLNLLAGEFSIFRPSAKVVRALVFLSLKRAGAKYTLDEIGELINPGNLLKITEALMTAWTASMPESEAEEENPTKAPQ